MQTVTRRNKPRTLLTAAVLVALAGTAQAQQGLAAAAQNDAQAAAGNGAQENMVTFDAFSEPVELSVLVEYIAAELLGWNYQTQVPLTGTVTFNVSQAIPYAELPQLLEAFLDQYDFALTYDTDTRFYVIKPAGAVGQEFEGPLATSKFIQTDNLKPSALQSTLDAVLEGGGTINYLDDLGAILVTAPARRIKLVEDLLAEIQASRAEMRFERIELNYLAAETALEQTLTLIGDPAAAQASSRNANRNRQAGAEVAAAIGGGGSGLDNLGDRLQIAPNGNALIFRGRPAELPRVREIIAMVDQAPKLRPKQYFAGADASQVAQIASDSGLGEVTNFASGPQQNAAQARVQDPNAANPFANGRVQGGGSLIVVDAARGLLIYYGTEAQQDEMQRLIDELDPADDRTVIEVYSLRHADAVELVDVVNQMLSSTAANDGAPLLPVGQAVDQPAVVQVPGEEGELSLVGADDVRVVADEINNQVLISAPKQMQDSFAKLIDQLDRRRPQVWIKATIVSVADQETFELAFETQLINAGGTGGAFQTGFGLTPTGTGGFVDPAALSPGLAGLTGGVILSEYLPIALNAVATETDTRIVSEPQLLVNDNEEASITSNTQQPTSSVSQGESTTQTSFGGFEEAGTSLTVTPRISEGGFMTLEYEIELSNFVGSASVAGLPPAREERSVNGSVSVPSDATIVIGGITTTELSNSVSKVPILGDIPLIGQLFRSDSESVDDRVLYVFITPQIMRDPDFQDLKLLTRGPQDSVSISDPTPKVFASRLPVIVPLSLRDAGSTEPVISTPQPAAPAPIIELPGDEQAEQDSAADESDPGVIRRRRDG